MKTNVLFAAAAMAALMATAAQAAPTVVYNTELGPLPGTGSTTTDATGTRSTSSPDSPRVSETFATNEWQQRNVGGDGVVGITTDYARSGNGSMYFSTTDGGSKADMEYYFSTPLALSSFEGATYDWYRDAASTNNGIQTPSLRLLLSGDTFGFAQLIFEPYYQAPPANVATNAWQTSAVGWNSIVWSTGTSPLTVPGDTNSCAVGCFSTLSNWAAVNQGLNVIGFSTGVGSGWNGAFKGAVDNIGFTFAGDNTSFNFEVSAVPEPGVWALMIAGFGLVGSAMRRRHRAALAA